MGSMCVILCVSVDGKPFGEVMWERRESGFQPSIDKPSDSLFVKAIKRVIADMIKFKPADRPSAREVVQKLEELQAAMQQIGEYGVIKNESHTLGRGEMATVFFGEHSATYEQVAVKEVNVVKTSEADVEYKEFDKEGKTAISTPPHKNVLKIHGLYCDHQKSLSRISLVTELCQLGNLEEYVKKINLSLDQKIDIMIGCAKGLAHLHKQKPHSSLYQDICPKNILLSEISLQPVVKLSPVSFTRTARCEEDDEFWYYKAPEQTELRGTSLIHNEKTEIFSMGMTNLALLEAPNKCDMRPRTSPSK